MEEDDNDNGEETVRTKRKPGRPPKGLVNPGKLLRQFSLQRRNEGLFIFLESQRIGEPQNCGDVA